MGNDVEKDHPVTAKIRQGNFYMEEFAKSVETEEGARFVYRDVGETLEIRIFLNFGEAWKTYSTFQRITFHYTSLVLRLTLITHIAVLRNHFDCTAL